MGTEVSVEGTLEITYTREGGVLAEDEGAQETFDNTCLMPFAFSTMRMTNIKHKWVWAAALPS